MKNVILERLDFEQGSEEWLAWRDNGCGSSDVRVIKGESKYKTRWQLWAEKLGIRSPDDLSRNPNVRRGNFFEPLVRETVAATLGVTLDVFCGSDKEHPWCNVSFDGVIRGENIPVEIKCPSSTKGEDDDDVSEEEKEKSRYWDLIENGSKSELYLEYIDQLQYQIGMLNAPYGYFAFYFSKLNKLKIYKVYRDEQLIIEIFEAVDQFYLNHVKTARAPEKDKILDYYEPSEQELVSWDSQTLRMYELLDEERKLKAKLKELRSEKDELTDDLMGKAHGFKQLALHALKINAVKGRETFQYKEFLESRGIEITNAEKDKFTRVGKSSARISVIKNRNLLQEVENSVINNQKKVLTQQLFGIGDVSQLEDDDLLEVDDYYITN